MLRAINLYQLVHQRVVVLSVVDNSAWAFFDPDGNCCYKQKGLAQIGQIGPNPSSPFLLTSSGNTKAPYHLDRVRKMPIPYSKILPIYAI